jgi:cytochrome P450
MDLVEEFAFPVPVMVIAALLGVEPEDRPLFREWALALQHASASRLTPSPEVYAQAEEATQGFIDYFNRVIAQRHAEPRQDLITALVKAQDEGDKLSDEEVLATCIHLLTAGHETTINLIAKGTLALLRNPDALKLLRSHPELMPGAVEELIRYDSPVQMVARWAYADIEIGGKLIRRGDSVGLILGSANRDPARFQNPDVLDLRREDCKHCGFGSGIHFCLGSALARAEATIALNVLLNRLPELRLVDETVEWVNNIVFHGPKHLRVAFRKPVQNAS